MPFDPFFADYAEIEALFGYVRPFYTYVQAFLVEFWPCFPMVLIAVFVYAMNVSRDSDHCDDTVRVVSLSGKLHSGKTTIARMIAEKKDGAVFSFATPLKQILQILENLDPDTPVDKTARSRVAPNYTRGQMLQLLGDAIRSVNPDIFVNNMELRVNDSYHSLIVIDDMRFPNELKLCQRIGIVARINRNNSSDGSGRDEKHPSETALDAVAFENVYTNREPKSVAAEIANDLYAKL